MKSIEIDDDLYAFIASQTKHIGENASQILRRLLLSEEPNEAPAAAPAPQKEAVESEKTVQAVVETQEKSVDKPAEELETPPTDTPVEATTVDVDNEILSQVTPEAVSAYTKRVDQFLFILGEAHRLNQGRFEAVEAIKGKNRTYFAKSKEALLLNGSSTNPKQIPDSPFWVVTNNNTAKKINMLQNVLLTLGYEQNIVETLVSRFS
ncbi:SeqA protein [Alteromonas sp. KUL49]|uniref:SeqA protein n=1 Tax=Alteromonas sp. KUL49 TaxID=2480798 RepID=UPI00102F085C|nr:SeqA protein [Alteromonas sp. KUL49]TAP40296.1 SeqA protein [Alteromonas sp. KUL49]GEA11436.1 negative modulator of initiation of replication [Alteromonas sp. KUL49]